jgi:hypothetical protein
MQYADLDGVGGECGTGAQGERGGQDPQSGFFESAPESRVCGFVHADSLWQWFGVLTAPLQFL